MKGLHAQQEGKNNTCWRCKNLKGRKSVINKCHNCGRKWIREDWRLSK